MTASEKQRIEKMRGNGLSYKEIAAELGMNPGSVKSYCVRHDLGGKRAHGGHVYIPKDKKKDVCEQCGAPVAQQAGRKYKRFCCYDCRMKWWAAHRTRLQQKTMHTFTCRFCGKTFEVYGETDRSFCSRACFAEYRSKGVRK